MIYGYTIADAADRETFNETAEFIMKKLHFDPNGNIVQDVDGSLRREFVRNGDVLTLESDQQIDYVAILSSVKLPVKCMHEWTK